MRLVLHIGGAKCGSSSIQAALRENWSSLGANGVLVPDTNLGIGAAARGQQIRYFQAAVASPDGAARVHKQLVALHDHMRHVGAETLVVSAENLINQRGYANLFAGADELFDLEIVAYVRRQDDYFASGWQQWGLKMYASIGEFLAKRLGTEADWAKQLAPWEERFGRERIVVRAYQRSSLEAGDVVDDFFAVTGLPLDACERRQTDYNRSWNEHAANLMHRVRDVFESQHDEHPFEDLHYAIGDAMYKDYSGSIVLTLDQRREIMRAYEESNSELVAKYLPEHAAGEPLFEPPGPGDVVAIDELEQLRSQQALLVRAILGLVKRVRELEQRDK